MMNMAMSMLGGSSNIFNIKYNPFILLKFQFYISKFLKKINLK